MEVKGSVEFMPKTVEIGAAQEARFSGPACMVTGGGGGRLFWVIEIVPVQPFRVI
jgi:hypothetical protein